MNALAAGHDAAVQMIDTSVVRVHEHGARIAARPVVSKSMNSHKKCSKHFLHGKGTYRSLEFTSFHAETLNTERFK
jgi:hypothetical protein